MKPAATNIGYMSPAARSDGGHSDLSETLLEDGFQTEHRDVRRETTKRRTILMHVSLVTVLGAIWLAVANWFRYPSPYGVSLINSPARSAVWYEPVFVDSSFDVENQFKGQPHDDIDRAWDDILQYQYLAVPEEDVDHKGSVIFNDNTGRTLVSLQVFDSLSCINYLRKMAFSDYYKMEGTRQQQVKAMDCVDTVRQAIMCYGDVAISTFSWKKEHQLPWPNFEVEHECRNWDSIKQWAAQNKAPALEGDILVHPLYGPISA